MQIKFRRLLEADIPQIILIEQAEQVKPWVDDIFRSCLASGCLGWVVEDHQKILGFVIASLSFSECHILNLCVKKIYQGQGMGRQLMLQMLQETKQKGAGLAYLEVRPSNKIAIALYRSMQFYLIGERFAYYPTRSRERENALVFAKFLVNQAP